PCWALLLLVLLCRLWSVLSHLSLRSAGYDAVPVVHHWSFVDSRLGGNNEGDEVGSLGRACSLSTSDSGPCIRANGRPPIPRGGLKQHRARLYRVACNSNVLRILDFPARSRKEKELQVSGGASPDMCAGILFILEAGFASLAFVT